MNYLIRDVDTNRIISYMGSKFIDNVGTIDIPVADERFLTKNFRYVVKTAFNSLPDAVQAESNLLKLAKQYEDVFVKGVPVGGLSNEDIATIKQNAKAQLLSDLSNIIEGNENSIAALQQRISDLEQQLTDKNSIINDWVKQKERWDSAEELYTSDIIRASMQVDTLERANASLIEAQSLSIDQVVENVARQDAFVSSSMSNLELKMSQQIEDIKDQLIKADNIGNIDDIFDAFEMDYNNPRAIDEKFTRSSLRVGTAGEFNELLRLSTAGTAGTAGQG
jgi:hypothetical protein